MTAARRVRPHPRTTPPSTEEWRILLADDDPHMRDILVTLFEDDPVAVLTAVDGRTALALWREQHPDLVLLDVRLPDLDGFAVCRQIRAVVPDMPIIFISAYADADHLRCGYSLDANTYLTKPIEDYLPVRLHILSLLRRVRRRRIRLRQMYTLVRANQERLRSRELHDVISMLEQDLGLTREATAP